MEYESSSGAFLLYEKGCAIVPLFQLEFIAYQNHTHSLAQQ